MRVNPNPAPDLLAALNQTRQDTQEALLQLSSGRRVNQPSDDPAAAALLLVNHDQAIFNARYLQNLDSIQGQFQTADSTLNSIVLALQRALTLGVQGANGTLSDSDRTAIAGELQGIQDQLISLANTSFQGRQIFAGTLTGAPPFVKDNTVASGVRYDGNDAVNTIQIGDGYRIAANKPGSQLFVAPGHDMFLAMANLIQAMQSNTGFTAAVTSLHDAFDYVSGQRVFYGNTMNQAEAQSTYLGTARLQLSQQENTLGASDIEAAASRLVNSQNATNATLAAVARISQLSLFDYLK
ncbi:MAG: flagellar hook-associated protein FlgL [Terriglobales bacterium]